MPKKSNAAERIVHATASLLASRGYFGTGLSDIIARAEAPKGSLYHYFPEGKPQIASAAIGFVADEVASFLDRAGTQAPHARNVLRQFTATLRGWLEHSRFEEACPVLSTSLSIDAELAPVHAECRRALRAWHASIERALRADGLAEKLAASRAWLILAALEGRSRWPASSGRSRRWMRSRKNCRRYCRPRRVSRPGRPGIRQCCTLSTAIASPETSR
ncbi:TetR/AcrR family transcriptional regulator [Pseudomonas aeruginosa]|uniref:TetR/AcrR family transcriptional regulator n=7 Tax=Pseudomonadota TaxID=1224 RepID=UPI00177FD338|nr:TetR/AcrR family transcriptional regulator [Pseudomonas aeruginosa]MDF5811528.1 TetR/AcrR family transcriptional regulator [Pseudomonas aeruginosa]MDF5929463.1 TetR/AcrR family transcriptional regulator [Pseudomonas aeruginosa]MDF5947979.1 TetR/AcrR family transcriptional regulator [Pseudomonas aeruginosa]MDF5951717.1 TetR/AcrR family transcriptional regulator [Pseudomonas aeruginosa]HCE9393014.1 TetR/AcrR family transcriptional regulator [Pseudomonas aeruginosa]